MTFEIRMKTPMGVRMEMVDFRRISEHHIYQYSGVLETPSTYYPSAIRQAAA